MPEGPFGAPRPLASGKVILTATVGDATAHYNQVGNILKDRTETVEAVDLDKSVDTYGAEIKMDILSLNRLQDTADEFEQVLEDLEMSVEGFAVRAR